jgi:copper chaperone CopZ
MSYYIHQIPGRLRIKSPSIKRNLAAAEAVELLLKAVPGVRSVAVNTVTGSIVISYHPKTVSPGRILHLLTSNGYFNASKAVTHDQVIQGAVSSAGNFLSKTFFGAVLESALEGSAWSLLAVFI